MYKSLSLSSPSCTRASIQKFITQTSSSAQAVFFLLPTFVNSKDTLQMRATLKIIQLIHCSHTHTHTCTYYIICRALHTALSNEYHYIQTRISSTSFRSGCQLQRTIILLFKPPPFPDYELVLSILNTNANPRLAANLKPKISGDNGYRRSHTIS